MPTLSRFKDPADPADAGQMKIHPVSLGIGLLLAASAFGAMGMQSVSRVQQAPLRRASTFSPPYPPEDLEVIPVNRYAQFAAPIQLEQGERLIVIGWNGHQHHAGFLFPLPLVSLPTSDTWIHDAARTLADTGGAFETLILDGPGSWVFATGTSAGLPGPVSTTQAYLLAYRVRTGG